MFKTFSCRVMTNCSTLQMWSNLPLLHMIRLLHMTNTCVRWCKTACHVEQFWSTWPANFVMLSKIAPHEHFWSTDNVCGVCDNYHVWLKGHCECYVCCSQLSEMGRPHCPHCYHCHHCLCLSLCLFVGHVMSPHVFFDGYLIRSCFLITHVSSLESRVTSLSKCSMVVFFQ